MSPVTELYQPEVLEQVHKAPAGPIQPAAPVVAFPHEIPLFADVLLEADTTERRRRRWAATSSIMVQAMVVGLSLLIPLMFTEALPRQQLLTFLIAPAPPPPPPPPAAAIPVKVVRQVSELEGGRLRAPSRIPEKIQMIKEEEAPPLTAGGGVVGGVPGGVPGGQLGGVIGGIISSTSKLSSVPKLAVPEAPKRMRISQGVTRGMRLSTPEPEYPQIARMAKITGDVVLTAVISRNGDIQNLTVISGHPLLIPAAMKAVRQWRYRPFLLNGEPVEVETTITVTFKLSNS